MTTALILIDLINEMVSPEGRLAGKGYASFAEDHGVPSAAKSWLDRHDLLTVHVGLQFRADYADRPRRSILLGKVHEFGVAREGDPGSDFVSWARPGNGGITIRKRRISAFHGTDLETLLRANDVSTVVLGGCATDLAVSSAARDAHDRDFEVVVARDLCVAAADADHEAALAHIEKIATLTDASSFAS